MSVKVKNLEWVDHPAGGLQAIAAGLGRYKIHRNGRAWYLEQDYMGSTDDPQAAAQADFERRILSAIERDDEIPGSFLRKTLRFQYAQGNTIMEMRENSRRPGGIYHMGDCLLVWVNEGDFWLTGVTEVKPLSTTNPEEPKP